MVLGVRHEPQHDTAGIAHTGDVADGAVGVGADVAQGHLTAGGECRGVRVRVATLAVGDRAVDRVDASSPDAATGWGMQRDPLALKVAAGVVTERARQQSRSGQDLEPVAYPDHWRRVDERSQDIRPLLELQCEHSAGAMRRRS